jgi:hypothetical protein
MPISEHTVTKQVLGDTKLPKPINTESEISQYFENCAIFNIRIIGDILLEVSGTTLYLIKFICNNYSIGIVNPKAGFQFWVPWMGFVSMLIKNFNRM